MKKENKARKLYIVSFAAILFVGIIGLFSSLAVSRSIENYEQKIISLPKESELPLQSPALKTQEPAKVVTKEPPAQASIGTAASLENDAKQASDEIISGPEDDSVAVFKKSSDKIILSRPCGGEILKPFSVDKPLKSKTMGDFRTHSGIDIKASSNTEVAASAAGVVEKVYKDSFLGMTVIIAHSENLKTQYSNLAEDTKVKEGDEVNAGDVIGYVGDTAASEKLDEAHMHFAVIYNDSFVNPGDYFK